MVVEVVLVEMMAVQVVVVEVVVQVVVLHKSLALEASEERMVKSQAKTKMGQEVTMMERVETMMDRKTQLDRVMMQRTLLRKLQLMRLQMLRKQLQMPLVLYVVPGALAMDTELATQRQESASATQVSTMLIVTNSIVLAGMAPKSALVMVSALLESVSVLLVLVQGQIQRKIIVHMKSVRLIVALMEHAMPRASAIV